jgi:hypothetical protein
LLSSRSADRPVIIFGGYVLKDKLNWLLRSGVTAEWAANDCGARAAGHAQRVADRIRHNAHIGTVVLNELIGHDESVIILTACRSSETLYAMGRKGGKGQLRAVCDEFERRLREKL